MKFKSSGYNPGFFVFSCKRYLDSKEGKGKEIILFSKNHEDIRSY